MFVNMVTTVIVNHTVFVWCDEDHRIHSKTKVELDVYFSLTKYRVKKLRAFQNEKF